MSSSTPEEYSSSILESGSLGSGSLGTESPQQALQTSSLVSITLTPSMTSLPSRQIAGDDASAVSAANYYNNNNNDSGLYQSQQQSYNSSSNKQCKHVDGGGGRTSKCCLGLSTIIQIFCCFTSFCFLVGGWNMFDDTMKYAYGISTLIQFELMLVCSGTTGRACANNGNVCFCGCFNVALVALIENLTVIYVFTADLDDESCDLDGCSFLHGPYIYRAWFLGIHAAFGLIHLIMTFAYCAKGCRPTTSRRTVTSKPAAALPPSKSSNAPRAVQKRAAPPRPRSIRSQPSSSARSSRYSQSSRASSVRSAHMKHKYRVKPSSASLKSQQQRRHSTCVNIPQQFYAIPQQQHSATVCHPPLEPSTQCCQQSYIRQQRFPFHPTHVITNQNDGGRAMIFDVPKTQQPYGFVDIQRVVVKLPPLKPSESASVPPALRDSSKQEAETRERVFCTKVTQLN